MAVKSLSTLFVISALLALGTSCTRQNTLTTIEPEARSKITPVKEIPRFNPKSDKERFLLKLAKASEGIVDHNVVYDPSYVTLEYPGGDVPANKGVCTDVLIRAYRKLEIDLQKEVHEDMQKNFHLYPKKWGLNKPDRSIDHRRVPNLQTFFKRKGESLPVTNQPKDYKPGDIVTWVLSNGLVHSGIVSSRLSAMNERYMIVHNIGRGQILEDMLLDFKITGHYRYYGNKAQ